jgi:hypothetical protein
MENDIKCYDTAKAIRHAIEVLENGCGDDNGVVDTEIFYQRLIGYLQSLPPTYPKGGILSS